MVVLALEVVLGMTCVRPRWILYFYSGGLWLHVSRDTCSSHSWFRSLYLSAAVLTNGFSCFVSLQPETFRRMQVDKMNALNSLISPEDRAKYGRQLKDRVQVLFCNTYQ